MEPKIPHVERKMIDLPNLHEYCSMLIFRGVNQLANQLQTSMETLGWPQPLTQRLGYWAPGS